MSNQFCQFFAVAIGLAQIICGILRSKILIMYCVFFPSREGKDVVDHGPASQKVKFHISELPLWTPQLPGHK